MYIERFWRKLQEQTISNQYHLKEFLGCGGYGAVYKAHEVIKDQFIREVAIKLIAPEEDEIKAQKQLIELYAISNFNNENIIHSYTPGSGTIKKKEYLFIVMEIAETSLEKKLKMGKISTTEVGEIVKATATALKYLHSSNPRKVHRDIKPANLLYVSKKWKVSDFGLLREISTTNSARTSDRRGTTLYVPPEAYDGVVGTAWDMWSLGIMTAEILTGTMPFRADTEAQLMKKIIEEKPEIDWSKIPEPFTAIVTGCLDKERGQRWTAEQVLTTLEPKVQSQPSLIFSSKVKGITKPIGQEPPPRGVEPAPPAPRISAPAPAPAPQQAPAPALEPAPPAPQPAPQPAPKPPAPEPKPPAPALEPTPPPALEPTPQQTPPPALEPLPPAPAPQQAPAPALEPEPAPVQEPVAKLNTQTFQFQVITVNDCGKLIYEEPRQAKYFSEDIGRGVTLEMVRIPGGEFMMGSPDSEQGRSYDESPQHRVTIPTFYTGKYPITQPQWEAVIGNNPSYFKGEKRPVEKVSWNQAVEFCKKLSQKTGKKYRLLSEAEWEYACRAGTTKPFHFGETITPDLVNYDGNNPYAKAPKGLYCQETTDVGSFPPNAFGLYDMHGNVWEWCSDKWHDNYNGAPTDGSSWETGGSEYRVQRGGSWNINAVYCRSAIRNRNSAGDRGRNFGFRVALVSA